MRLELDLIGLLDYVLIGVLITNIRTMNMDLPLFLTENSMMV